MSRIWAAYYSEEDINFDKNMRRVREERVQARAVEEVAQGTTARQRLDDALGAIISEDKGFSMTPKKLEEFQIKIKSIMTEMESDNPHLEKINSEIMQMSEELNGLLVNDKPDGEIFAHLRTAKDRIEWLIDQTWGDLDPADPAGGAEKSTYRDLMQVLFVGTLEAHGHQIH